MRAPKIPKFHYEIPVNYFTASYACDPVIYERIKHGDKEEYEMMHMFLREKVGAGLMGILLDNQGKKVSFKLNIDDAVRRNLDRGIDVGSIPIFDNTITYSVYLYEERESHGM